jgi:hypothetical protein
MKVLSTLASALAALPLAAQTAPVPLPGMTV